MTSDQLVTIALVVSGPVGVVAMGLALLAYLRFRHTSYHRLLQPLVCVPILFMLAHGLVLLWPSHPPVVDLLEPLAFTALGIGVVRLIQLHPRISEAAGDDRR